MKAAVVHAFGEPLTMDERDIPDPGPGEILVRIEASGLCHTDVHAAHGDWPVRPALPFVPGHEGVGIIEALGRGVMSRAVGERVALPWLGYARAASVPAIVARLQAYRVDALTVEPPSLEELFLCQYGVDDSASRADHDSAARVGRP